LTTCSSQFRQMRELITSRVTIREKLYFGEKMYFIRPALRHLEGRCLCTCQGSHPLSDSERADSSLPNNLRKEENHITYLSIKRYNTMLHQEIVYITRSRSSFLSFSLFSLIRLGPCRPEIPIEDLSSGSPKIKHDSQAP